MFKYLLCQLCEELGEIFGDQSKPQVLSIARVRLFMYTHVAFLKTQSDVAPDVASLLDLAETISPSDELFSRLACCDAVSIAEHPDLFVKHIKQMVHGPKSKWTLAKISAGLRDFEEELGLVDDNAAKASPESQQIVPAGTEQIVVTKRIRRSWHGTAFF